MKANEAPEKIYLYPSDRAGEVYEEEWATFPWGEGCVEYTRTDAIIEKAAEYIANNMRCDGYRLQSKAKFIRDFKTYMKGE